MSIWQAISLISRFFWANCSIFSKTSKTAKPSMLLARIKKTFAQWKFRQSSDNAIILKIFSAVVQCMHRRKKAFQEQVAMAKWKVKYNDIAINSRHSLTSLYKVSYEEINNIIMRQIRRCTSHWFNSTARQLVKAISFDSVLTFPGSEFVVVSFLRRLHK